MPATPPRRFDETSTSMLTAAHELWRGVHHTLKNDIVAGALLLAATVAALLLANSPAASFYEAVRDYTFGPAAFHLDLSVQEWAADGLLAIFFFVVGLELKEELVAGTLRNPRAAAVPIAAAVGGVAVPALVFVAINAGAGPDALKGWAIPAATDIAFAAAVLAVVGQSLPPALRTFLLTLAIVDDLIAITVIATVYTSGLALLPLLLALIPLTGFAVLVQRGVRAWWVLIPLAVATWALVHASGVHATIAGVLLAFTVPVHPTTRARVQVGTANGQPIYEGLAAHFADRWEVLSITIAVPAFAFLSAGVTIGGLAGLRDSLTDTIAVGIFTGLVVGKMLGIVGTTFLMTRLRGYTLDRTIGWLDLLGMSFLGGIGFTVALLVGELSYGAGTSTDDKVKIAVLLGSCTAAVIGAAILAARNRRYRHAASKPALRE